MIEQHPDDSFILYMREAPLPDMQDLGLRVSVKVLRWPVHALWNLVRLSLAVVTDRLDVLFVPAHTIPLVHPRKTVTTLHDVGFERWAKLYSRKYISSTGSLGWLINGLVRVLTLGRYRATELDYHRWSARFAVRSAAHIITISEFSKKEIMDVYGAVADKITVIPLGLSAVYTKNSDEESSASQKIAQYQPYIYFIGRLEEKKNIAGLLSAYELVVKRGLPHQLVLAGAPGLGFDEAIGRVPQSIRDRIHVLGWVSQEHAAQLMRQASVFFFPSFYEGFGLPLLEAFAVDTPVVASNVASIPEVVGDAALTADPHDPAALAEALNVMLTDATVRNGFIARGHERLQLFSWDACAANTYEVLAAVAQSQ